MLEIGRSCEMPHCGNRHAPAHFPTQGTGSFIGSRMREAVILMGPGIGGNRVVRGGGWYYGTDLTRCANRNSGDPTGAGNYSGFRCVRGF